MSELPPRSGDPRDQPMLWEPARAFAKVSIGFVLAGAAAFVVAILLFTPDQTTRALGPLAAALVAAVSWALLARGRTEASVLVLTFGLWAAVSTIAFFTGGVRGMAIIVYPQLILLLGWLIGTRAAIVMTVLAVATTFGFAVAESWGYLPVPPPTPPALRWVVFSFIFAFSAMLVLYFVRAYQSRLHEAGRLAGDLALRTAEVQAREADLNHAQAVAHVGSWIYDIATDVVRLSAETCRIFGLPEGTTGSHESYLARVHPEDRAGVDRAWHAALAGDQPFDNEHRILVGGAIRWVRQQADLQLDADGRPLRGVGTSQDITERKLAEEALRESESRFRHLTQLSSDWYWEQDENCRFTFISAGVDVQQRGVGEHIGKTRWELPHIDTDPEVIRANDAQVAARKPFKDLVIKRMGRDGAVHYAQISGEPLFDASGQFKGYRGVGSDITERKRVDEALRKSEVQLQCILGSTLDGILAVDRDGNVIQTNRRFAELWRIPPALLQGRNDKALLDYVVGQLADPQAFLERVQALYQSNAEVTDSVKFKDGRVFERFTSPLMLNQAVLGRVWSFRDITERTHAQEALRESEERYRSLFANSNVAMLLIDPAGGGIVDANAAACAYYGWELPALKAMRIADINTLSADAVRDEMTRARNRNSAHFDFRHRLASGEVRDVEVFSGPIEVDGRRLLLSIVHDVTASRKTQAELRKSIAFRELLLEAMPVPIFYKDTSGCYAGCNRAYCGFVGRSMSEIIGKTVQEVWPSPYAQAYQHNDIDLLKESLGLQSYESQVPHADGTIHDVIVHKARMSDDAGNPSGILGVFTDITEIRKIEAARDRLEAQLRESQKMEALGTLAGGVAHDFNNILAAIIGNVELAWQDVGPDHRARESLEEIRKASRRAKDMVQQILAFGRRQVLERKVIALAPVVEESARLLRQTLPAGVSLAVACAPDAPAVLADATQVQQVLLNLCANAWQAMQGLARPGAIEILLQAHAKAPDGARTGASAVRHGAAGPGRCACLTVRDNGSGMDRETRARVFEPFFTTKPVGKGTGLGLAVVHGIVQDHGASIAVESVPGEGSAFHIYFPAVEAPVAAVAAPARERDAVPGRGQHILYVDDDEAIVYLMQRLLERQGYRASAYTDPRDALAAVRAQPQAFDLAVTDFNMPGMSGLELARALREIRADLPVALASGYITEELRAQAPAAGVIELVYKPNTVDELCEVIARLAHAQHRQEQPW